MVEPEMAFAHLDDVMTLSERMLSYIAARVLETRIEELKILERDTAKLEAIVPPFPRMHYDDAVKLLHEGHAKGAMETRFEWGGDFGAPDETYLSANYDKPLMVHHYPAEVKAFYMARDTERSELALGVVSVVPASPGALFHFGDGGLERLAHLQGDQPAVLFGAAFQEVRRLAHAGGPIGEGSPPVDCKGFNRSLQPLLDLFIGEGLKCGYRFARCRIDRRDEH